MGRRVTQLASMAAASLLLLTPGAETAVPPLLSHHDVAPHGADHGVAPTTAQLRALVAADEFTATELASVPAGEPGLASLSRHVSPSCSGTGTDGNRVQVIYAVEKGRTDRYSALKTSLRSWVADVDDTFAASAAKTGGGRRVRWVHQDASGGCVPTIAHEVLPKGALSNGFQSTVGALRERGYKKASRKYLVFADSAKLCGVAGMYEDSSKTGNANDGAYATYARVDSGCWAMSSGGHSVAAHELMHMLGGVQNNAPHSTKAGHCRDETDAMCYDDGGVLSKILRVCGGSEALFDCRNDDYFHTKPASGSYLDTRWNTADSSFLDKVAAGSGGSVKLSVKGSTSMRAGLSRTYRAVTSTAGKTFRWTASPAACVPGKRTRSSVVVSCPAHFTGKVSLKLAVGSAGGRTTRASKSISLVRSPKATVSTALDVAWSAGKPAKVTARLTYGKAAVRGTVALYALSAGEWTKVSAARDTGVDGRYTWSVRPGKDTRYSVRVGHAAGGGWLIPRQVGALVRAIR